jgi:hypothetical protein
VLLLRFKICPQHAPSLIGLSITALAGLKRWNSQTHPAALQPTHQWASRITTSLVLPGNGSYAEEGKVSSTGTIGTYVGMGSEWYIISVKYKIKFCSLLVYFFSLGKATKGPAGATRGGLGTRHRGAAPQRAGARARTRAGALPSWESHQPSYARSAVGY